MPTPTSITHFMGESDSAMALATKLDPYFKSLWFVGAAARAYAFQLNKPKAITIAVTDQFVNINGDSPVGVYDVDGVPVTVIEQDVAAMLAESRYAGEGFAVKLSNGGLVITPESWNLPPETRIRDGNAELTTNDAELVLDLKAFTTEMRQKEMENQTAKAHFEKLQADEEARIAAEAALADAVPEPENQQLELALGENSV